MLMNPVLEYAVEHQAMARTERGNCSGRAQTGTLTWAPPQEPPPVSVAATLKARVAVATAGRLRQYLPLRGLSVRRSQPSARAQ